MAPSISCQNTSGWHENRLDLIEDHFNFGPLYLGVNLFKFVQWTHSCRQSSLPLAAHNLPISYKETFASTLHILSADTHFNLLIYLNWLGWFTDEGYRVSLCFGPPHIVLICHSSSPWAGSSVGLGHQPGELKRWPSFKTFRNISHKIILRENGYYKWQRVFGVILCLMYPEE